MTVHRFVLTGFSTRHSCPIHRVTQVYGTLGAVELRVVDHPLVAHKLTHLREESTPSPTFRLLVAELVTLLAYEATRQVRVAPVAITTPVSSTTGTKLSEKPLAVPILRAGLGMLEGFTRLLPMAEVGFVGMARDERTLKPTTYAERLPHDLSGRQCYVLDPMLATGGSLAGCVNFLAERGADDITCICILAAPEGIERVRALVDEKGIACTLVVASIDEGLNERGYIVPGLGDAGDRLYGLAE
ncbi:Uracil phosphoribosyltransferase [Propionibacterium australiense]|uniref:Uracil phosphoribosyltransferase n=1 Tax=Propionibacterium australiense TaxID=119981 RepID=A0A383S517_9ACTN|nr:uracil phosphoribosyltransferase [Propionibacterium australiense]VEH89117.1 Uracil phosphoribosyltransferase [Propionibacterium australiense]